MSRSSRREVFCRKDVLRNFANFSGKHLYQSLFFNKVPGLSLFFKKETLAQVFFREFCDIFKSTCFNRTPLLAASVCPVKLYPKRYSFKLQVIKFANLIQSLMQFIFSFIVRQEAYSYSAFKYNIQVPFSEKFQMALYVSVWVWISHPRYNVFLNISQLNIKEQEWMHLNLLWIF